MDNRNLIVAILLSVGIMTGWNYFFEKPRAERLAAAQKLVQQSSEQIHTQKATQQIETRDDVVQSSKRIKIETPKLSGSINLEGARFDDLTLLGYKKDLKPGSLDVDFLSPSKTAKSYFAEFGWYSNDYRKLPSANTIWKADKYILSPESSVQLTWTNEDSVKFIIKLSVDKDYMFKIEQLVDNQSKNSISIKSYGLINRSFGEQDAGNGILHQGPLAVIGEELKEQTFDKIKDKKHINFEQNKVDWIGISDKYWLSSFIPDKKLQYICNFNYAVVANIGKYQTDFLSEEKIIPSGGNFSLDHKFFAGAKKVDLLDKYEKDYQIKLFDRAIDFGWFYILTKPMFHALNFFYGLLGNFGLSILLVTVIVKILMFGMANKSYRSMQEMKNMQPEIERLKAIHGGDQARFNQEMMELYKRKKINPLSGCLPLILQIPVFFSLYKVLYVTLEMRHTPFYGWIHDLSSPDPTSMFNLFGLLPITVPAFLMIGAWPILMSLSMYLQQKMSPPPADPMQAKVMSFMPLILLVMFSSFPAGLVIYWTWNNILSIIQQKLVTYNYKQS